MQCAWIQDRLVAYSDGELSPGEATRVGEHLDGCEDCADLGARLLAITPEPHLQVPPEILAQLASQVDQAVHAALDEPVQPLPATATTRWARWLRRDRDVSNGQLVAAAVVFAMLGGWGLSNWMALPGPSTNTVATAAPSGPVTIDSDQYEPASYRPDEDGENWR